MARDEIRRRYARTIGFSVGACAVYVFLAFVVFRSVFDPGSVTQHSTEGHPPIVGITGILALLVGCAGLTAMRLTRRVQRAGSTNPVS